MSSKWNNSFVPSLCKDLPLQPESPSPHFIGETTQEINTTKKLTLSFINLNLTKVQITNYTLLCIKINQLWPSHIIFLSIKVQPFMPRWMRLCGNLLALVLNIRFNYCPFSFFVSSIASPRQVLRGEKLLFLFLTSFTPQAPARRQSLRLHFPTSTSQNAYASLPCVVGIWTLKSNNLTNRLLERMTRCHVRLQIYFVFCPQLGYTVLELTFAWPQHLTTRGGETLKT